ncbi:lipocalin family protein [Luteimonas sp. SJ-16]|uniref:Outer membrane lipoprotein Blc n=2 Tax=Luteimonas deserti TaxID=2752306 RepID=A0A7Z0QND7_9GAMM|nr:lipocalin family protein [Luteimonas deserti]NYZ61723.1 lipocalin family protein [Luteimonas deserti]
MLAACGGNRVKDPIPPVPQVDVERFMGDWYVIAQIPTRLEREAYDSVETYTLREDGKVDTTFRYRDGGFDEKIKTLHPVGTMREGTGNAIWGMQFVWPIKAEYVIVYLDEDYQQTIVGRSKRDYVWLMARTPAIPEADYAAHIARIRALGYDVSKIRRVPQSAAGASRPVEAPATP